ncbi:hypothetical protein Sjap_011581 [Stephania japonica]|uniref:Exostosin GT47 domain-containing protein n=1 Tax=Stephania japonica TaxID=461633 RepID=A0AAP0P5P2_9MAGN
MANAIKLRKPSLSGTKRFIFFVGLIAVLFLVIETSMLPRKNRVASLFSHGEITLHSNSVRHAKINNISFNDLANSSLALDMVKKSSPAYSEENMKYSRKTKSQNLVLKTDILASELKHRPAFKVNEKISHDESASKNLTEKYIEVTERDPMLHKGSETAYGLSLESKKEINKVSRNDKTARLQRNYGPSNTSMWQNHLVVRKTKLTMPPRNVIPIKEMNRILLHRQASYPSVKPRRSSKRDQELLSAKLQILNAPKIMNDQELYDPLFRNVSMFKRSYELMERMLKVYVYKEGEKPIFHLPILKGIYASEGWFMKLMEGNKKFIVKDPRKAHLFYMPFSSRMLEHTLYVRNSHNMTNLAQYVKDYTLMIATKYPFWNRTSGADHFFVACHDWAPYETRHDHMEHCIKSLCNADVAAGFKIGKDVSLPETYVRSARNPQRDIGGKSSSERHILAFFAGNMHGYLRPVLLSHWENKDPYMKIFGPMPPGVASKMNYINYMKSSKYCICAKGFEVNSPRVVEAIFYECVPVIISDNFVPPFFEVLNWEAFSVIIAEKDIPLLKDMLLLIPHEKYVEMQLRVKKVRQHFVWHSKPVKYDLFHMILHSIWYNRLFMKKSR